MHRTVPASPVAPKPRAKCAMALIASAFFLMLAGPTRSARAQENSAAPSAGPSVAELAQQITDLRAVVQQLQAQVAELQARPPAAAAPPPSSQNSVPPSQAAVTATPAPSPLQPQTPTTPAGPATHPGFDFLHGTTVNFAFDGYYAYNFNDPIGRVNLLRAYDVLSNIFGLNQAD